MSETELLARCRNGDQSAFADLIGPQRRLAWNVAFRITGNREDAEDALQNALVGTWQNLNKFNGQARFSTWFYRVVSNAALEVRRRNAAGVDTESVDPDDLAAMFAADTRPSTENRVADTDAVQRALAELPEVFREAIVLREFADLSYAEIAEHQRIGVATVKSRISRARTQLVEALTPA